LIEPRWKNARVYILGHFERFYVSGRPSKLTINERKSSLISGYDHKRDTFSCLTNHPSQLKSDFIVITLMTLCAE